MNYHCVANPDRRYCTCIHRQRRSILGRSFALPPRVCAEDYPSHLASQVRRRLRVGKPYRPGNRDGVRASVSLLTRKYTFLLDSGIDTISEMNTRWSVREPRRKITLKSQTHQVRAERRYKSMSGTKVCPRFILRTRRPRPGGHPKIYPLSLSRSPLRRSPGSARVCRRTCTRTGAFPHFAASTRWSTYAS